MGRRKGQPRKPFVCNVLKPCECGCGEHLESVDSRGRPRRFILGHHNRLKDYSDKDFSNLKQYSYSKGHKPWNKGQEWLDMAGENNPQYIDGRTRELGPRWSKEYRRWRKAVLRRDNFTCQQCGATEQEAIIHAHHIKSFRGYPELRYDINNGLALCWDCHKLTDDYSGKRG